MAATDYIARGMNPYQATQLYAQVSGTSTDLTGRLLSCGFAPALAAELTTQMVAGVGNEGNLRALGMPNPLCVLVAADIEATASE